MKVAAAGLTPRFAGDGGGRHRRDAGLCEDRVVAGQREVHGQRADRGPTTAARGRAAGARGPAAGARRPTGGVRAAGGASDGGGRQHINSTRDSDFMSLAHRRDRRRRRRCRCPRPCRRRLSLPSRRNFVRRSWRSSLPALGASSSATPAPTSRPTPNVPSVFSTAAGVGAPGLEAQQPQHVVLVHVLDVLHFHRSLSFDFVSIP